MIRATTHAVTHTAPDQARTTFGWGMKCYGGAVILLTALTTASCTGVMEGPSTTRPSPICDNPEAALHAPLMRLHPGELERSLDALFGEALTLDVSAAIRTLPQNEAEVEGGFARMDQRLSGAHVDAYYRIADMVATQVSSDPPMRQALVGECGRADLTDSCLQDFLPGFLLRAYRRAPTAEEVERVLMTAAEFEGAERLHAVVFITLMSPDFLYRFETRGEPVEEGDSLRLTGYELAARLSFHFWGAPPDDALLDAAATGALDTEVGLVDAVNRLVEDPRMDATIIGFFDEWLHLARGPFTSSPRLDVLRDGLDVRDLHEEMQAEVRDLLRFHLQEGDSWGDVLTSPYSFARGERLAGIYGVEAWDGDGAPPLLPPDERSGLLTRAGMLYTADGSTNPFRRGAFLRRAMLCDPVPSPPTTLPADALVPPPVESGATTRESFEAKISEQPCAGCHAVFSPLGYAMEAYDGLGRHRLDEWLVTVTGEDLGFAEVHASVIAAVDDISEAPVSGPVELSEQIAESPKSAACFASTYFRFTYRRAEERLDACLIDELSSRIHEGESLRDALRGIALSPAFRLRRLEE